jgi:RNA polymerase sigma-70 factor, ECF subfamily
MSFFTDARREEIELVRACQDGHGAAFASFYERYFSQVYRYALGAIGNRQDAEDVAAEVFIKAFRGIDGYQDHAKPIAAWLFRIARNEVADHFRRSRRKLPARSLDAQQIDLAERFDPVETGGRLLDLAEALRALPRLQQDAILLRLVGGLSTRETAEVMRMPEGTVRSHLHHGITGLREAMER